MTKRLQPKVNLKDETTIRTFTIGTIALLEDSFGDTWGHSKDDEDDITDEEEYLYEKFLEIRERILDLGNDLIFKQNNLDVNKQGKIRRKIYGGNCNNR